MSDISKCGDNNCPLCKICYRYTAPSNDVWQTYLDAQRVGLKCNAFWDNREIEVIVI